MCYFPVLFHSVSTDPSLFPPPNLSPLSDCTLYRLFSIRPLLSICAGLFSHSVFVSASVFVPVSRLLWSILQSILYLVASLTLWVSSISPMHHMSFALPDYRNLSLIASSVWCACSLRPICVFRVPAFARYFSAPLSTLFKSRSASIRSCQGVSRFPPIFP